MYKLYNVRIYEYVIGKEILRKEKQRMSHFTYCVPSYEIVFLNSVSEMHVRLVTKKQCSAFVLSLKKHLIWLNAHLAFVCCYIKNCIPFY
jgi:hypothetical protein